MADARTYPHGVPCWIDTEWTKMAVLRDPQGTSFTLSQFTPPTP